jgi:hypothetical protein
MAFVRSVDANFKPVRDAPVNAQAKPPVAGLRRADGICREHDPPCVVPSTLERCDHGIQSFVDDARDVLEKHKRRLNFEHQACDVRKQTRLRIFETAPKTDARKSDARESGAQYIDFPTKLMTVEIHDIGIDRRLFELVFCKQLPHDQSASNIAFTIHVRGRYSSKCRCDSSYAREQIQRTK